MPRRELSPEEIEERQTAEQARRAAVKAIQEKYAVPPEAQPYKEALEHVVCLTEPLYYRCPAHRTNDPELVKAGYEYCLGCQYEHDEALIGAMNVLSGLPVNAHWGDAFDKDGNLISPARYSIEELHAAWEARGFEPGEQDGREIWKRGTSC